MLSLYLGLDIVYLLEAKAWEFNAVYTSSAMPVCLGRSRGAQFVRLQPQLRDNIKPKNKTTYLCWSNNISSLVVRDTIEPTQWALCYNIEENNRSTKVRQVAAKKTSRYATEAAPVMLRRNSCYAMQVCGGRDIPMMYSCTCIPWSSAQDVIHEI
jgi:hypothetical protein